MIYTFMLQQQEGRPFCLFRKNNDPFLLKSYDIWSCDYQVHMHIVTLGSLKPWSYWHIEAMRYVAGNVFASFLLIIV